MISIREQIERLNLMSKRIKRELINIQDACPHENKEGQYGANTGNWCSSDDSYWIDIRCVDCLKNWRVYSDQEGYSGFKGTIYK